MNALDSKELVKVEDVCIYDAPPPCAAKCPLGVDARGIAASAGAGDFSGAYKLYSATVCFPRIIAESCGGICQGVCLRSSLDGALQIAALERACVEYGYKKSGLSAAFLPKKSERVAIVGGGLSGLTAAYYVRRKGYSVDLYEKTGSLGGALLKLIPEKIIQEDTEILFELGAAIHYNREIRDIDEIARDYDATYLADGVHRENPNKETLFIRDNLFGGVHRREYSSAFSMADGKRAATSIERHLQKVSKTYGREKEGSFDSDLKIRFTGVERQAPIEAAGQGFSKDEAILEGKRCLDCHCEECLRGCAFLDHYKTNPKKFIREVRNCLAISVGDRFANSAINSCSECGFCGEVCPAGLDTGLVCGQAKRIMVETGKMPPSAHDFALKDMAHANGEDYFLAKHEPGKTASAFAFFPGCQLGATAPELVEKVYAHLRESLEGGVGLILGCCGATAKWAARDELFRETLDAIKNAWLEMGKPEIITACPTCYQIFTDKLPEMKTRGIWSVLETIGLPAMERKPTKLALHDPCTIRNNRDIHETARRLLSKMGMEIQELENSRNAAQCCGYGGLTGYTNRELSDKTAAARISQSGETYLTYCVNCRDRFMANGKKTYHLLELVYGGGDGGIRKFGWSERRLNRERLKRALLRQVWGEAMEDPLDTNVSTDMEVSLDDPVIDLIESRMILLGDIKEAIKHAEDSGKKLKDSATGAFIAARKIGSVTFWVWYSKAERGYAVHRAYSHRMDIEGM